MTAGFSLAARYKTGEAHLCAANGREAQARQRAASRREAQARQRAASRREAQARQRAASRREAQARQRAASRVVARKPCFNHAFRSLVCERPPRPLLSGWLRDIFLDVASTPPQTGGDYASLSI